MPQRLPRYYMAQERAAFERKLGRILLETGEAAPDAKTVTRVSHADPERLRGLPAIGRNVGGATVHTDPVRALLAKERRRR